MNNVFSLSFESIQYSHKSDKIILLVSSVYRHGRHSQIWYLAMNFLTEKYISLSFGDGKMKFHHLPFLEKIFPKPMYTGYLHTSLIQKRGDTQQPMLAFTALTSMNHQRAISIVDVSDGVDRCWIVAFISVNSEVPGWKLCNKHWITALRRVPASIQRQYYCTQQARCTCLIQPMHR